ncbi:MAG: serine hydrolase [Bacteroidota bacterium]
MKNPYVLSPVYQFLIILLFISSCSSQSTSSPQHNSLKAVEHNKSDELDKLIGTYADYGEFNGAVLVAEAGSILYQKGLGLANMEWDIANQTDTKFRIASISKQFTAMAIVQLVSENKLDLHAPISTYLPDYPQENGKKITIHHLLTHSSGIPNSYESANDKVIKPDNHSPAKLVAQFSALPLEFTPGETFSYCNAGYTVLGYILETVTNNPYEQVLRDRIFAPLNMKNTGFDKHRPLSKNRASGYFKNWGEYYNANYVDMSSVYAAGALYSTVEDLFLWDQALYSERLVPNKYLELIFHPHIADPDYGGQYGYGWSIKDKPIGNSSEQLQTIGHDGVIDGFCAIFTRIPSSKSSIILLSNIRRAPLNAMTKGIMGILYDQPYDFPTQSLAYSLLEAIEEKGSTEGVQFYKKNKKNKKYYLSEDEMNVVSYKLLQSNRGETAAEVLRLAIEAFPTAFNLYDSYGEVLRALGNKEEAINNYRKSVQLNPDNDNGIRMLKELGVEE